MKQKRSINEALDAAKALRKQVSSGDTAPETTSEAHLKVVGADREKMESPAEVAQSTPQSSSTEEYQPQPATSPKPVWVRHTIGLRDATSLKLRDAADGQKRKERYGQLAHGEPANEQEIADLGIQLALKQLGYLV